MILHRYLARILQESLASENTCKNLARTELSCKSREILQVSWKNLARKRLIQLTDIFCKNLPRSCISCTFCKIFAIFCKNNALSCKILQETSKNLASFVCQINQGGHSFNSYCRKTNQKQLQDPSVDQLTNNVEKFICKRDNLSDSFGTVRRLQKYRSRESYWFPSIICWLAFLSHCKCTKLIDLQSDHKSTEKWITEDHTAKSAKKNGQKTTFLKILLTMKICCTLKLTSQFIVALIKAYFELSSKQDGLFFLAPTRL